MDTRDVPEEASHWPAHLGVRVDRDFPDPALNRTRASMDTPAHAAEVYRELCERAEYGRTLVSA